MRQNMKFRLCVCVTVCLTASIVCFSDSTAKADPTGIEYVVTTENAPNTASGIVTFDGIFETVLGTGIDISEGATPHDGGELIEFWVRTTSGNSFVAEQDDMLLPSSLWIEGLRWRDQNDNDVPGFFVFNSAFIYFTFDGQPLQMGNPLGLDITFAPHPLDPTIQTLLLENGPGPSDAIHLSTELLAPGTTFVELFTALELPPTIVNDFHFGALVRHIPEPSAFVMALIGIGLLFGFRRRPKR